VRLKVIKFTGKQIVEIFQFQFGAIKRNGETNQTFAGLDFNSNLVRLKEKSMCN